jgi:hypothetical protein
VIKTPDVVNLDKSHVSFCGKAFRFRKEIERSLHETKSEISWNREAWVHETKSEFVEGRGERCTKSSRNSSGKGESGRTKPSRNSSRRWRRCRTKSSRNSAKAGERRCTKSCRNSSVCGRRPPRHCQRVRHRTAGERGERLSSQRRKRRYRKRKKYPTQVGYFYMKTDFDVVCFQKVSRPKPF